ncbi:MAG: methylmalonyl-CoA mutase [Flavobacteriales bacterium]|nr:methylmalonyl-CoA mutase [Flavobacteriales bacterium]
MKKNIFLTKSKLFQNQTKKDWKNLNSTEGSLNNNDKNTYDPIYFQEENSITNTFNKNGNWDICVEIDIKTEKQANKDALKALKYGANSISFLNFSNQKLSLILKNIQIDIVKINFKGFKNFKTLANKFIKLGINRYGKAQLHKLKGVFYNTYLDPHDFLFFSEHLPNYRFLSIPIQSTEFTPTTLKYEHTILDNFKNTKAKPLSHIIYLFEISNNFLIEIAKIRAFRIAYKEKYRLSPYIKCVVSPKKSKINPLIETTTQSISSILGGCNELLIKSKKLNIDHIKQQLILKHESYLDKVSDPLHGSYYIETISHSMNKIKKTLIKKEHVKIETWDTFEGINIKNKYLKNDIENIDHINFGAGEPPFLRGPYSTMYCQKKWTIRQYSGFSTAEESNKFYKKNLAKGQTGLSIAFDLPTHRGYDSDHERVLGDVGKAGVAIDSMDDMELLFDGIDLSKTSVSMTMNGAVIPIMAFFIAMAEKTDVPQHQLRGTIQNDILKEFMVRNTYIYPPKASMRIIRDIFKYTAINMPKFNSISVSGYHMLEAGASADIEVAYTLCDGLEYVKHGLQAGLKIDDFVPRLSFFWGIGMNFFMEIAKMRAARILWAQMMATFKPKNKKSLMLRSHCQTSGWSLTKQNPQNNITRTTIEALAAVMGGTQSLHTNALDEAIALPTNESAKIARDTQIFLQNDTDICSAIDPFGGSYYLEVLTNEITKKAKQHIEEIEKIGGMVKAIEAGMPKLKIEASAIKRQAKIDNGENLIIGLNCFQEQDVEKIKILQIDNKKVLKNQLKRLKKIKTNRVEIDVQKNLEKIKNACFSEKENLLSLAIQAAKSKATLGEISYACETVFDRYKAKTNMNSGIYAMEKQNDKNFILANQLTDTFKKSTGRRPRILAAKLGQDGHDRGIKIIATSFSDMGFDVDIAPLFQTPEEIVKQALENDVHIIGISSLAGGHKTLIPELLNKLKEIKRDDIMVILGGIIPEQDYHYLHKKGIKKIFGPGTIVSEAAIDILNILLNRCK